MSFPPAHFLVGAGAAELAQSRLGLARWQAWGVGGLMALLPDLDFMLGLVMGRASAYHGTFTHSLTAVAVVAAVVWVMAGPRWSAVSAAGYASHLLVDLLDERGQTNVMLAWPVSEARPFAIARLFPTVPFEQGGGVRVAFLSLFERDVLLGLVEQTATAAAFFAAAVVLSYLRRRRARV